MNVSASRRLVSQIVFPFAAYVMLFVGMGLVAGSVVHFGEMSQFYRFAKIGIVGMGLFALGSYLQERHINPQQISRSELLSYVLYSLLLAIGIGMISGGTQHFLDFPRYASFLLPVGLVLSLVAYVQRQRHQLSWRGWNALLVGAIALSFPLFLGLNHYAQSLTSSGDAPISHHGHGSPTAASHHSPSDASHSHTQPLKNDIDFLTQMIPHHQEAIETSAYLLTRTTNPELQTFLRGVIEVQSEEVDQMRQWYQQWTGQPYQPGGHYQPMMASLTHVEGKALEQTYLEGMVAHHLGAIDMAQQLKTISQRPELQTMAQAIIQTQSEEVEQLQAWLQERT